jgi:hypothetical protein
MTLLKHDNFHLDVKNNGVAYVGSGHEAGGGRSMECGTMRYVLAELKLSYCLPQFRFPTRFIHIPL